MDDLVNLVNPDVLVEPLYIAMPAGLFYDNLCKTMRACIVKLPKQFRRVMPVFTLEALEVLRQHMLQQHLGAGLREPTQTTGMRGGMKKTWKVVVEDTASFKAIIGRDFLTSVACCVAGTGIIYDESAVTAWLPPLEMTVTASNTEGTENAQCVFQMASGRITEHGFDWTRKTIRRTKEPDMQIKRRYLAQLVFDLQAQRVALNAGLAAGAVPLPGLDHQLLLRAAAHM